MALTRTVQSKEGREDNYIRANEKLTAVKTALYAGEIHSLEMLLLSLDENTTEEEIKERQKELRNSLSVRKKPLTTYKEAKTKKGEGVYEKYASLLEE